MLKEYNDYRLTNPNGISRDIKQYLPSRFDNERMGAVDQYPARRVRQQARVAQTYDWRPEEDWEDEDGDSKKRERVSTARSAFQEARPDADDADMEEAADALSGNESAFLNLQFVAATVSATAVAVVAYISSLIISVSPCSATTDTLAFLTSVQNPDNVPLQAVLTSDAGTLTQDATNAAYLIFSGLDKGAEYALSIVNAETGESLYRRSYVTATEDPVQIAVENASLSPDGTFSFDFRIEGLQKRDFYTISVMDANGHVLFVADGTEEAASFSISTGETYQESGRETSQEGERETYQEGEGEALSMPFVMVSVNGKTYMPQAQPLSASEEPQPSETPQDAQTPSETPQEAPPEITEDAPETPEEAPQPSEEPQAPSETPPQETSPETPDAPQPVTPETSETPQAQTPSPTPDAPQPVTPDAQPSPMTPTPETPQPVTPPRQPDPPQPVTPNAPQPVTPPQEAQTLSPTPETPENPPENPVLPEGPPANWAWAEDYSGVTAEFPDPDNPDNMMTRTATVTQAVSQEASCTEEGLRIYTASIEGPNGEVYTDTRTEVIPAKGHHYERVSLQGEDGHFSAEYVCADCGRIYRLSAAVTEDETA